MLEIPITVVLASVALAFAALSLALLVPLYGKLFFATHTREYVPIEEYTKIRQGLGLEKPEPMEEAHKQAQNIADKLFGVPTEEYAGLRSVQIKDAVKEKPTKAKKA